MTQFEFRTQQLTRAPHRATHIAPRRARKRRVRKRPRHRHRVMPPHNRALASMLNEKFRISGLSLSGCGARATLEHLSAADDEVRALDALLDVLSRMELTTSVVKGEVIERAIRELRESGRADAAMDALEPTTATNDDGITICDAFKTKRYAYDSQRRMFDEVNRPSRIESAAEGKIDLYRDRFLLLEQRLSRSRQFNRSTLRVGGGAESHATAQLTSIQSLLGVSKDTKFIMGCLSQLEDDRFYIEDLTGTVRVDLTACETSMGLFTENCVVIAEGEVRPDGVFEVIALTFPPSESRENTRNATNALDFFGAGHILRPTELPELEEKEMERIGEQFVVLADVWLDQQRTFDRLAKLFEAFDSQEDVPGLMVFMGDFTSTPFGPTHFDFRAYSAGFDKLAELLEDYPRLRQESRFVFVPGPGDPGLSAALPRPGLQPSVTGSMLDKVPRAHFASNPAKIRYFSQDLVFFREDLQAKMRRNCLIPPDDTKVRTHVVDENGQEIEVDAADRPTFQHLAATLVQQAHLCPLPITQAPIYWEFDHALWLYPAPQAIFLGDRTEQQSLTDFEDTVLTNPGCFGGEGPGEFLTYCPATGVVQFSAVP